jgi:MFS superfamily sulfate permease-like transporter
LSDIGRQEAAMLVAVLIVVGAALLTAVATAALHRGKGRGRMAGLPAAPATFGVVGTLFAVILGFVIFSTFDSYQGARTGTEQEAVSLQQMDNTAGYFDPAVAATLRGELFCYARSVIADEWPRMVDDRGQSPVVDTWIDRMDLTLKDAPVSGATQSAALSSWFDENAERQDGRRGRLAEAQPFVPDLVWALMITLTVLVLAFQVLFADPGRSLFGQVFTSVVLAVAVGIGMSLIWVLDRPFADRGSQIHPAQMQAAIVEMAMTTPAPALPCDAAGRPTAG